MCETLSVMKAFFKISSFSIPAILLLAGLPAAVTAQEATPAAGAAAPAANAVPAATLEMHTTANLQLLNLMEAYADALGAARDRPSAEVSALQIDALAKEAALIGEKVLKLGKPTPEIQSALVKNQTILEFGKRVKTKTREAAQFLAANPAVANQIKPSMRNFQKAMSSLQKAADAGLESAASSAPPATPASPAATPDSKATAANGSPPAGK